MKTLLVFFLALMLPGSAVAVSDTAVQTITVHVENEACLSLDTGNVTFPNDNPRAEPKIPQIGSVNIQAEARTSDTGNVSLTALAGSDLLSGADRIPIGAISWTGSGAGFVPSGVLSDSHAQTLGQWDHSGIYNGAITYSLINEWDYPTGTYTATVTYTLTAL
jgi:hypothetical protein